MTRLWLVIGVLGGALALNGCSSSSGTTSPVDAGVDVGPPIVTVSGTAAPHPLTTPLGMNPASDFSEVAVAVVDPSVVIANPNAAPLAGGALDTSAANCGASGCAWSFDNVNISTISLGLVGIIDDLRPTGRVWVKTGTGAGAIDFINTIKISRAPITNRTLFVVSEATEAKLAAFAAAVIPDATLVAGSLETRGFMVGTIVSKLSEGAMPVAGASVSVPASETQVTILYPNDDFSGPGTATAVHGTFLVVPKSASASAIVTTWTVKAPTGDSRVWPMLTAGTTPGTAFVILFAANE